MLRFSQDTLQRPLEFIGKLVEHHAQSPVRQFLMLAVWTSIAEAFLTVRSPVKFIQKVNNCQILVKYSWLVLRGVSSRPGDLPETFRIHRQARAFLFTFLHLLE